MIKKYAIYCSGGASRALLFFKKNNIVDFPIQFILYDGKRPNVSSELFNKFGDRLIDVKNNVNPSDLLFENLIKYDVDYLFCFGDRILKGEILKVFKNKIINFHPSLLPSFPGLNAIDKALATSVQVLGNTAHFIDEGIDTGPIIMQSLISRNSYSCYEDVLSMQIIMLEKIWKLLDANKIMVINNMVEINYRVSKQNFFTI